MLGSKALARETWLADAVHDTDRRVIAGADQGACRISGIGLGMRELRESHDGDDRDNPREELADGSRWRPQCAHRETSAVGLAAPPRSGSRKALPRISKSAMDPRIIASPGARSGSRP